MTQPTEFQTTHNNTTTTKTIHLTPTDKQKLAQYLTTILTTDPDARYNITTENNTHLDINPLRTNNNIDIIQTTKTTQDTYSLTPQQAQTLLENITQ